MSTPVLFQRAFEDLFVEVSQRLHTVHSPQEAAAIADPSTLAQTDRPEVSILEDRTSGCVHVVTDRLNIVPVYVGRQGSRTAIGTNPDNIAAFLGIQHELDLTSMAQALRTWTVTFPYTYYSGIRELEPAAVHTWDRDGNHKHVAYWQPRFRGGQRRSDELAEQLAAAIRNGVYESIGKASNVGLLLSAGADSRGILFAIPESIETTCYTFYDQPNSELKLAARLAAVGNRRHVALQRTVDHYGDHARLSTRLMSGMWNFLDAHATGFIPRFESDGIDLLLSGDFADLLFKGNSLNTQYKTLAGKNLTIKELGPFSSNWRSSGIPVNVDLGEHIRSRVATHYAGINTHSLDEEGWWHVAHRRVGILSRAPAIGGPASLRRGLPWKTFMADRAMMDVYEQLTTTDRVNGTVWEKAIKMITPPQARNIPNNNWGARVGATNTEKTARFLYGVAYRKLFRRDVDGTPLGGRFTRGSWPEFGHYLYHSQVIGRLWNERDPETEEIISTILGYDPWVDPDNTNPRRWGVGFGRLLTLKLWLEGRRELKAEEAQLPEKMSLNDTSTGGR